MSNVDAKKEGIFINGKAQAIEILRMLEPSEKKKLLANMRLRNPEMTMELSEKSISFKNIEQMDNLELRELLSKMNAKVVGVAIKESPREFQRRVLSLMVRTSAVEAYEAMTSTLRNEKASVEKAKERMVETTISMQRRRELTLS